MNDPDLVEEFSVLLQMLPYASELNVYEAAARNSLQQRMRRLIISSSFLMHLDDVANDIRSYIKLFGFRFSKSELISLVKFGLSVVLCKHVDPTAQKSWENVVLLILRNDCAYITRADLQLDWKPFRDWCIGSYFELDPPKHPLPKEATNLILAVKRFFPPSNVEEIWDFFKGDIFNRLAFVEESEIFDSLITFTPAFSWTFDEIRRLWLDEIFNVWYKFPDKQRNKEVVMALACLSPLFPGRVDMAPHLDRLFSFLLSLLSVHSPEKRYGHVVRLTCILLINSIVPGSSVIERLSKVFQLCKNMFHASSARNDTGVFVCFCKELLNALQIRLNRELNECPQLENYSSQCIEWAKLTADQVDEIMQIVLPMCLEENIYSSGGGGARENPADTAVRIAAMLRPGLVFPRLLASLDEGFSLPHLRQRVSQPLHALAVASVAVGAPGSSAPALRLVLPFSPHCPPGYFLGKITPRLETEEQREYCLAHALAMAYPEGRAILPRMLRSCYQLLNWNERDRLSDCIKVLECIYMTSPMRDFSGLHSRPSVSTSNISSTSGDPWDFESALREALSSRFSPDEIARSTVGLEDATVDIFSKVVSMIVSLHQSRHSEMASVVREMPLSEADATFLRELARLAGVIAFAMSGVPAVRERLLKRITDTLFSSLWSGRFHSSLRHVTTYLLHVWRGSDHASITATVTAFWTKFSTLVEELKGDDSLIYDRKVDARISTLLDFMPALFTNYWSIPLATAEEEETRNKLTQEFLYPLIDTFKYFISVSLGSDGAHEPSKALAEKTCKCLCKLLTCLFRYSVTLGPSTEASFGSSPDLAQSPYLLDPLWTPFISSQEAPESWRWHKPRPEALEIVKRVTREIFLPLLDKLAAVTEELRACFLQESYVTKAPRIPVTTKQTSTSNQREYLLSLSKYVNKMAERLSEVLEPRETTAEELAYAKSVSSTLEKTWEESVGSIQITPITPAHSKLPLPYFDIQSEGMCLRERIFQVNLAFLDVLSTLSDKYDFHIANGNDTTWDRCVAGSLYSAFDAKIALTTAMLARMNLTCEDAFRIEGLDLTDNSIGSPTHLFRICGSSKLPSQRESGFFRLGLLPLACLMNSALLHNKFLQANQRLASSWPSMLGGAFFTHVRSPVDRQLMSLVDVALRFEFTFNEAAAFSSLLYRMDEHYGLHGLSRAVMKALLRSMRELTSEAYYRSEESLYQVKNAHQRRALSSLISVVRAELKSSLVVIRDPELWAKAVRLFAQLSVCPKTVPGSGRELTAQQMQQRFDDCTLLAHTCSNTLMEMRGFRCSLYFHSSMRPEDHPRNSCLRRLLTEARAYLTHLGGCVGDIQDQAPPLTTQAVELRRNAFRSICWSQYEECLKPADLNANKATLVRLINYIPTAGFTPDNPRWQSQWPEGGDAFRMTAPPPPPPPRQMVSAVLDFCTSDYHELAWSALGFVKYFLVLYFQLLGAYECIPVDPKSVKLSLPPTGGSDKSRDGLLLDPLFDCLAKENFTRENFVYNLSDSTFYLDHVKTCIDPLYSPPFPADGETWFNPPAEMDRGALGETDLAEWREGILAVYETLCSSAFWSKMARNLLHRYRCQDPMVADQFNSFIHVVAVFLGPEPLCSRLEEFCRLLLEPALSQDEQVRNGMVEFMGPMIANAALKSAALGCAHWSRRARMAFFTGLVPRVLVSIEVANQLASSQSVAKEALKTIHLFASMAKSSTFVGGFSWPLESRGSEANQHAYRILCELWNPDDEELMLVSGRPGKLISADPQERPFFPFIDFASIFTHDLHPCYAGYIWRYVCELVADREAKSSGPPTNGCGHTAREGDDGECPVCFGRRLLPNLSQRRSLMTQFGLGMLRSLRWDRSRLLRVFHAAGSETWESLAFSHSSWKQLFGFTLEHLNGNVLFDASRHEKPPVLGLNDYQDSSREVTEHTTGSVVENEVVEPLLAPLLSDASELGLFGEAFLMKRFLPLLVRDSLAMLILEGCTPSKESFRLQKELLENSIERLTPATIELMKCCSKTKAVVLQRLKIRLVGPIADLTTLVENVLPMNPDSASGCPSQHDLYLRLASLFADIFSTSTHFVRTRTNTDEIRIDELLLRSLGRPLARGVVGHTDPELIFRMATNTLKVIGVFLTHPSWKARLAGLKMVGMHVYHMLPAFWPDNAHGEEMRRQLKQLLSKLLADPQLEVAREASEALATALQAGALQYEESWFRELVRQSRANRTSGGNRCRSAMSGAPLSTAEEEETALKLRRWHAGVLGLGALVAGGGGAETPPHLPAVIAALAEHGAAPPPIADSVANALRRYEREHESRWHLDRELFTPEQLDAYTSVVRCHGASYFV